MTDTVTITMANETASRLLALLECPGPDNATLSDYRRTSGCNKVRDHLRAIGVVAEADYPYRLERA